MILQHCQWVDGTISLPDDETNPSSDDGPNGAAVALLVTGSVFIVGLFLFVWIYRRRRLAQAHTTEKNSTDTGEYEHSDSRLEADGDVLKRSVHDLQTEGTLSPSATLSPSSALGPELDLGPDDEVL